MTSAESIEQDRKDLQRGVLVNYLGYPLKAAHPVLMVLLVRAYGAEAFGLFTAAQAVLLFLTRLCALGLDKALLWWIPQQEDGNQLRGVRASLLSVGCVSVVVTAACMLLATDLARLADVPEAGPALRIMSASLLPMTLLEVVLGMTMGTRKMGTNVLVRETIQPMSLVVVGLAVWPLGFGALGLCAAMTASYTLALSVAAWRARSLFSGEQDDHEAIVLPRSVWNYAWPMWLAEMGNTFLQRLDMWAIAALADLRTVGIYGVVVQFGNTIRSIRRGYDPVVLAITAQIGAKRDNERLAAAFSYATSMVVGTQVPVLAFIIFFAQDILPLYGEGFADGVPAVMILGGFWVATSIMTLAGIVVSAYGRSGLTLFNTVAAALVQAGLLWLMVPHYGLNGAAFSVGITYSLLSGLQLGQMRVITGGFHYRSDTAKAVAIGLGTGALLGLAWWFVPGTDSLYVRAAIFLGYAGLYVPLFWPLARRGVASTAS